MKPFIVTGFPYSFPYYWKVFEFLENKDDFVFVLPEFWSAKDGKIQIKLEQKSGFEIHGLKAMSYGGKSLYGGLFKGWMPGIVLKLVYFKFKYGSKVLYSCSEPHLLTTLYNGFFTRLFGYKHILFTWQNVSPEARLRGLKLRLSNALVRLNLSLSDGIICGNIKAADIIRKFKVESPKFKVIICPISGVDTEKFKPEGVRCPSFKVPDPLNSFILFYGALDKRKGVSVLIEAFSQLLTINSQLLTNLVIIGTGPEQENLKLLVANYKLQDKVIFKDWMKNDDLPAVLSKAAVFVYPSVPSGGWEEQFGYAMAEASACAVPVVATRTGSIEEVVTEGKNGLLVKPNDPHELAGALYEILSNNELRNSMGLFGRKYVQENFSHQVIASRLENFLKNF